MRGGRRRLVITGFAKIKKVHVHALDMMTRLHEEESGVGLHLTVDPLIEKGDKDRCWRRSSTSRWPSCTTIQRCRRNAHRLEVASLHPLVDTANIECGAASIHHVDGNLDAKAAGAEFHFNVEVQSVARRSDGSGFDVAVKRQRSAKAAGDANTDSRRPWQ